MGLQKLPPTWCKSTILVVKLIVNKFFILKIYFSVDLLLSRESGFLAKLKKKNIKGLVKIELGFEKVQYKIIIFATKKER